MIHFNDIIIFGATFNFRMDQLKPVIELSLLALIIAFEILSTTRFWNKRISYLLDSIIWFLTIVFVALAILLIFEL